MGGGRGASSRASADTSRTCSSDRSSEEATPVLEMEPVEAERARATGLSSSWAVAVPLAGAGFCR